MLQQVRTCTCGETQVLKKLQIAHTKTDARAAMAAPLFLDVTTPTTPHMAIKVPCSSPKSQLWLQTGNWREQWPRLERKIVEHPFNHAVSWLDISKELRVWLNMRPYKIVHVHIPSYM